MADDHLDSVFRALGDPTRRALLEKLREREGLTLGEMADGVGLSRFGVMKHLSALEKAGLIRTERAGRLKLHYLERAALQALQAQWLQRFIGDMADDHKTA